MRSHSRKGFSLLEVMVAVAILGMALLTIIDTFGVSALRSRRTEDLQVAVMLAREKMAEVLLFIDTESKRGAFPDDKKDEGKFDAPFDNYEWTEEVKKVELPVPGQGGDGEQASMVAGIMEVVSKQIGDVVREVKVTVKWKDINEDQSIDVVTHIMKP